jgi:DNA-binding NarL/FixJ family response regulator
MGSVRVLVADSNEITRKSLCAFIREQRGWEVVAEASDGREAVAITKRLKPDVAILDLSMPSLNGLDAARHIAKNGSQTKVLVLALRYVDLLVRQALEMGAYGYLLRSDTAQDLISAVETLSKGRRFFTKAAENHVLNAYLGTDPKKTVAANDGLPRLLTGRQREIVQMIAEGCSSKQVAGALQISVKTAETHRANVMRKLECHAVADLVRYAIRNHIIEA